MEQLDNDMCRELHQKLIHRPTQRERKQANTILDHNQCLSTDSQQ